MGVIFLPAQHDWFLAGQMLDPGEPPATSAFLLSKPQRTALMLCLSGDRLDFSRRAGWQHPESQHKRITDVTILTLAARGLMVVVARGPFRKHARLTTDGDWYARTLVDHAITLTRTITRSLTIPQKDAFL